MKAVSKNQSAINGLRDHIVVWPQPPISLILQQVWCCSAAGVWVSVRRLETWLCCGLHTDYLTA